MDKSFRCSFAWDWAKRALKQALAFPFLVGLNSEKLCNRGCDILDVRALKCCSRRDILAVYYHGNDHILGKSCSVGAVVAAVVCGDDNGVVVVKRVYDALDVVPAVFKRIITKRIISPLKKLTSAVEMLADGNVDIKLDDCKTGDEIGFLAEAFEKTTEKLKGYMTYINELAYKDSLTGIRNRTAYSEAITELDVKMKLGECEPFGIVVADVNGLKITNDKYGHEIGNKLLIKSSKAICDVFKRSPVFRIGGDEFVVILKGEDLENYAELLCLLDNRLDRTFINVGETSFKVSVARAVAIYDSDTDSSFDDVFNSADKKMYENKKGIKSGS